MAAATIDFRTQATFPIRLGASISKPAASTQFTGVRYNWKPDLKQADNAKASIREGDKPGESRLLLRDDAGEYTYAGRHVQDEDSFVLVLRGQGKDREAVLERMSGSHAFNLISTPSEKDATKLAELHPLLPAGEEDDNLFGEDDEAGPPDDSNPFDFRHFLKAELEKPESTNANLDVAARSTVDTPLAKPVVKTASASKVVKRAETKATPLNKRKAAPSGKASNKRAKVKAGEDGSTKAEPSKAKAKPDLPKIHMDRKASLRRPSFDDSGEIILENPTPVTEKPKGAMALALNGQLGSGPISLKSAANSPASHAATSPAAQRPEDTGEEYVFEFDDEPDTRDDDDDADGEDADVDDLELPSPAQVQRPSLTATDGNDEDDLDAQLARAMMEAEDGGQEDNESEESEEE